MSTAPTLVAHASVSMVNGAEKLGRANIGAEDSADFRVVNAVSWSDVQTPDKHCVLHEQVGQRPGDNAEVFHEFTVITGEAQ